MAPRQPEPADILTVSALTRRIRLSLENEFPYVWVSGEVSQISRSTPGHQYITLKDEASVLSTVLFRGVGLRMKFEVKEGMQVLVRGRISVFEPIQPQERAPRTERPNAAQRSLLWCLGSAPCATAVPSINALWEAEQLLQAHRGVGLLVPILDDDRRVERDPRLAAGAGPHRPGARHDHGAGYGAAHEPHL